MSQRRFCLALMVFQALIFCSLAVGDEPIKSSLQPGESLTATFEPLNVTGPFAGEPHCLVCENGANPVAMVFARELSEPLIKLVAKLDAATAKHSKDQMGSFVVFLSEKQGLADELKAVAKRQNLKHTILAIDPPAGPDGFKVAKEADVTVVLYVDHTVKANHAFAKGQLNEKASERILADLAKILPAR
jgi:hypothetical protein